LFISSLFLLIEYFSSNLTLHWFMCNWIMYDVCFVYLLMHIIFCFFFLFALRWTNNFLIMFAFVFQCYCFGLWENILQDNFSKLFIIFIWNTMPELWKTFVKSVCVEHWEHIEEKSISFCHIEQYVSINVNVKAFTAINLRDTSCCREILSRFWYNIRSVFSY